MSATAAILISPKVLLRPRLRDFHRGEFVVHGDSWGGLGRHLSEQPDLLLAADMAAQEQMVAPDVHTDTQFVRPVVLGKRVP